MKNHLIDTVGQAVEAHYRAFLLALTAMTADAMSGRGPTGPHARAQTTAAMMQLQGNVLTTIAGLMDSAIVDLLANAAPAASDALGELLMNDAHAQRAAALGTLAAAMHRDVITAVKRLRDFSLRVDMLMQTSRRRYSAAVEAARIAETREPISYHQFDVAGRKWKASVFAAATVKGALQGLYADAVVRAAAAEGVTTLEVRYPDPAHEGHGQRVSLTGDAHPSYLSLRDEVFHPNSSATLVRPE
jgi:hypothetical protein